MTQVSPIAPFGLELGLVMSTVIFAHALGIGTLLDGSYWNTTGDRRRRTQTFTYDDGHITHSVSKGPSAPMTGSILPLIGLIFTLTEEQKARARAREEERKALEAADRERQHKRYILVLLIRLMLETLRRRSGRNLASLYLIMFWLGVAKLQKMRSYSVGCSFFAKP